MAEGAGDQAVLTKGRGHCDKNFFCLSFSDHLNLFSPLR